MDDIIKYKTNINTNVKILHRVNECDPKREISINIEPILVETMKFANHVVFVSSWLRNYFINKYSNIENDNNDSWLSNKSSSILNGVDLNNFTGKNDKKYRFKSKYKIQT